jgi:ABC-type branched-subunit amino acid transport system permease subunit
MRAVADDPVAAAASGVAPAPPRIFAFVLAALMAGGAGGLYVANVGYIDPASAFSGTIELETVLMVLAGGI